MSAVGATTLRSFLTAALGALEDEDMDYMLAITTASAELEAAIQQLDDSQRAWRSSTDGKSWYRLVREVDREVPA